MNQWPLILTKFYPPKSSRREVSRTRLTECVDNLTHTTLCLIYAPPGAGKTTLVGQWCRALKQQGKHLCWISLGKEESLPENFLRYLSKALVSLEIGWSKEFIEVLETNQSSLELLLISLGNELLQSEKNIYLFFDDYHLVDNAELNECLGKFLLSAPDNVTFVICSRCVPALPLNKLRANGSLQELSFDALQFDFVEVCAYLKAASINLTIRDVERLLDVTEGWAVGLQLLCLSPSIRDNPTTVFDKFSGVNNNVKAYIEEIVLKVLPKESVELLVKTSILERLCVPLCEAVTGIHNADKILAESRAISMFMVELDNDGYWYRHHHLFAAVLHNKLESQYYADLPLLHERASQWFLRNNLLSEAVRHALAAGRIENTFAYAIQAASSLAGEGDIETLSDWLKSVYVSDDHQRFHLDLTGVWGLAHCLNLADATQLLERTRESVNTTGIVLSASEKTELSVVSGIVANISDDTKNAVSYIEPFVDKLPLDRPWIVWLLCNGLTYALTHASRYEDAHKVYMLLPEALEKDANSLFVHVYRKYVWSIYHTRLGDIPFAMLLITECLTIAEQKTGYRSNGAALAAGYMAGLLYEQGAMDDLERVLAGRLDVIEKTALLDALSGAYLALCRVKYQQGFESDANQLLENLEHLGITRGWSRLVAQVVYERLCLSYRQGDLAQAEKQFDRLKSLLKLVPQQRCALSAIEDLYQLAHGRMLLLRSDAAKAINILSTEVDKHQSLGNISTVIIARILYVHALNLHGDLKEASTVLDYTITMAEKAGFYQSVLDDIVPIIPVFKILKDARKRTVSDGYFLKLMEFCECLMPTDALLPSSNDAFNLSPREQDVLKMLYAGKPNKLIARELDISLETVKWHLKNIYIKLGVSSRLQAITASRE